MDNISYTNNNAICLNNTNNYILDLFILLERNIDKNTLDEFMSKAWIYDPIKTIAVIFNSRDRLSGKKEKKCSNDALIWIRNNCFKIYKLNILNYINLYGCWKDLVYIALNVSNPNYELKLIANQLINDINFLKENKEISLCSKWCPSENKNKKLAFKIANYIFKKDKIKIMKKFRNEILVPLKTKLNLIETKMCNKEWDKIEYNKIPANSLKKFKKAFIRNDIERYNNFLQNIKINKNEIKITGILPYELVRYYLRNKEFNETIELQWKQLIQETISEGYLNNTVAIVDVSGSMYSYYNNSVLPIEVSISMGLLIANCNQGFYNKKVITFSNVPILHNIQGNTLYDQLKSIKSMEVGLNTNFIKSCELIINSNNIPDKIICLSDMQFDEASENEESFETIYEIIKKKFELKNYEVPKFIFWNLNCVKNTFPISCSIPNTAMLSGYSEQLIKAILKDNNFTAEYILNNILEKYIKNIVLYDDISC